MTRASPAVLAHGRTVVQLYRSPEPVLLCHSNRTIDDVSSTPEPDNAAKYNTGPPKPSFGPRMSNAEKVQAAENSISLSHQRGCRRSSCHTRFGITPSPLIESFCASAARP